MKKEDLVVAGTYFLVTFLDKNLLVPIIRTHIYLGENIFGERDSGVYFQESEKFFELGRWELGNQTSAYGVIQIADDMLDCVHDYQGLQHELELMIKGGANYYE
ncbi:MAG: hypothetical protein ACK8QZ_07135 [Anaerolineales bacterium]